MCTDVALDDGLLLASYGALQGSTVVVLDAADLRVLGEAKLPEGVAWALAARGEAGGANAVGWRGRGRPRRGPRSFRFVARRSDRPRGGDVV